MSSNSRLRFLVVLLLAAFASATLVLADVGALGQNINSSTTDDTGTQGTGDVSGDQTDLSGTYTGRLTMSGGHEMTAQATLTITGNTFTLEGEGMTHSGRVYAVTTRGYTGAAFYFNDMTDSTTNTSVVANVQARKRGDRLTLSPVPGSHTRMTFGAAGGGGRGRRGRRATSMNMSGGMESNSNTGDNSNSNTTTPPR